MLDRIEDLHKLMQSENISAMTIEDIDEENINNDRELIQEFLQHTIIVQDRLADMEKNNQLM